MFMLASQRSLDGAGPLAAAVVARAGAEELAVASTEMRRRNKAAGSGDPEDRLRAVQQEIARMFEPQGAVEVAGGLAQLLEAKALQMARRQVGCGTDGAELERILEPR